MSERYSKLFSLPENLYATGSPAIISAGALLKDNQTGKVLAQLKIRSISQERIKAITVSIQPKDTVGISLGEPILYQYLDLDLIRDEDFGQKIPILLSDATTRVFDIEIKKVIFWDNSIWTDGNEAWESLSSATSLQQAVTDCELVNQYKLTYGQYSNCIYTEVKDLWYCDCGAINHIRESLCHSCHTEAVAIKAVDWDALKVQKDERLAAEKAKAEAEAKKAAAQAKKSKKLALISAGAVVVAIAIVLLATKVIIPARQYKAAENLLINGQYEEAISAFEAISDYKDSVERIKECTTAIRNQKYTDANALRDAGQYEIAVERFEKLGDEQEVNATNYAWADALQVSGDYTQAAMKFGALGNYANSRERSMSLWNKIAQRDTIAAGAYHTVAIRSDGTVVAAGTNYSHQCDVSNWSDIIAVSAEWGHTVGLRSDGTVVATGNNDHGECNVSDWTDIVAISAGSDHTVGLCSDGTVVVTGDNSYGQCNVSAWKDIISISASSIVTGGIQADGTVLAIGGTRNIQQDVSEWSGIVAISGHSIGLRSDGTVVAVRDDKYGIDVSDWKNIIAVSHGVCYRVGLCIDGTVVATGYEEGDRCNVSGWRDIVAVSAGDWHTVGLRADGTMVVTGSNHDNMHEGIYSWTNLKLPTN